MKYIFVLLLIILVAATIMSQTATVVDSSKSKPQTATAPLKFVPLRPIVMAVPPEIEVICDVPFSVQLGATGGKPPYIWTGAGLPPGTAISSTGVLSGTITCASIPAPPGTMLKITPKV